MVGVVERDEALGVFGGGEDGGCIVDADDLVARRMEDHERALESCNSLLHLLRAHVVDEVLADPEPTPGKLDAGFSVRSISSR
jgi:hypothetical protein